VTRRGDDDDTVSLGKRAGGAVNEELPAIMPGDLLGGRYQVIELLGQGGMGAVYLASDEALAGKPVALKVVARPLDEASALEELRHEVLLAQQVTHRNVCRIYDLERIGGRWIVKMEWIAGETLIARVARGRLPVGEAVAIAKQIATGLEAAHREGVIHRDLKPGNVMLEAGTGRVVLMDFGIAQSAAGGGGGGGGSSDQAGTPAYMAPEQLRGERVDARSDVYALGCVLYHMLVGEVAWAASTLDTANELKVTAVRPLPDPRTHRPEVPPWLGRAVQAMIAHDAAARPRDAAAVLRLLDAPARRRRWMAVGAAVVGVTAAAVAVGVTVAGGRGAGTRKVWVPAIQEIEPAFDENVDSVAWSPDGTRLAFSSDREKPGTLRARVRRVAGDGHDEAPVSPPEKNALFVSWSGDGESLYFTDIADNMATWRVPARGGELERIGNGYAVACGARMLRYEFSSPGCPNCPRFVLREAGGAEREVLRLDSQAFVSTYRCDRAGERVVWARAEQGAPFYQPADLWIAELATGKARQLTDDRRRNSYPCFTPDGKSVVFASARSGGVVNLWELSLESGKAVQLTFGDGNDLLPDVSPDGTRVAFSVDVTSAPLFARVPGATPARLTPARVILIHPQVMPGGDEILAADFGPLQPRIVAVSVHDGKVRALGDGVIATVTPDGKDVVYVGGGTGPGATSAPLFVVPAAGGEARPLATLDGRVRMLRAGPDGVVHAMVDRGAALEAWRVPTDGSAAPSREAEAPWCFVQPAPAGGWSVWIRCSADGPIAGALVAPGAAPDTAVAGMRMDGQLNWGGDFDARGEAYFVYEEPAMERIDVATGARTTLFEAAVFGATVSPDGKTVYSSEAVGRSRRHIITNFADRVRP
jgi:Tol biopolymer transport system component